ncbi:RsmD family RNA methyltransferase [Rasiella sp. SM2506]|uniref:RsmD family RNA methyltransferase n=1 Tax=Rasiella sp. SM2506 TaxID=3423914 RepID=UPI003D7B3236
MRIISGTYKGKRLMAPKNLPVRPTTDFAKEALFNILNHQIYFPEVRFLDLFAGTGNISFEFASRGCEDITSVDAHYGCVKYIQQISDELSFNISALKSDVFKYTQMSHPAFDVIFSDPPYNFEFQTLADLVENIFQNNLLNPDGLLIIEHTKHISLSEVTRFQEARKYGSSVFSFFA